MQPVRRKFAATGSIEYVRELAERSASDHVDTSEADVIQHPDEGA
jgi:hypothetical protein